MYCYDYNNAFSRDDDNSPAIRVVNYRLRINLAAAEILYCERQTFAVADI